MTDMSERDRRAIREFTRQVRVRIWAWDPAGLAIDDAPDDEYDCLVGPVTGGLREGLPASVLADRLGEHVAEHFGVKPLGTKAFAADLVAWYREQGADSTVG